MGENLGWSIQDVKVRMDGSKFGTQDQGSVDESMWMGEIWDAEIWECAGESLRIGPKFGIQDRGWVPGDGVKFGIQDSLSLSQGVTGSDREVTGG